MARSRSMYEIQPGYAVFTTGGDELGRVKEVRDGAFKVDAPWKGDYWLPLDMVLSAIPGDRVTVDAEGDEIARRQVDRPAMGPDEYLRRYERGYRSGMDFDPETSVYRDRRGDGGAWGWEARGYESRGARDPENGGWGDPETNDIGWRRPRTKGQWGEPDAGPRPQEARRWRYGRRGGEISQRPESAGYRASAPGPDDAGTNGSDGRRYRAGGDDRGSFSGAWQRPANRPSYLGHGPKGYQRSDSRIFEDVCEALAESPELNPSEIEVVVEQGEVRLTGTVETRYDKRLAEDIACSIRGVRDVHNELKAQTSMMTGVDHPKVGW